MLTTEICAYIEEEAERPVTCIETPRYRVHHPERFPNVPVLLCEKHARKVHAQGRLEGERIIFEPLPK